MLSDPALLAVCVGASATVTCCLCVCVTVLRIATTALRGSRSTDRPAIIRALTALFRRFLKPWWKSG